MAKMLHDQLNLAGITTFDTLFYIQRFRVGLAISTEDDIRCVSMCAWSTGLLLGPV